MCMPRPQGWDITRMPSDCRRDGAPLCPGRGPRQGALVARAGRVKIARIARVARLRWQIARRFRWASGDTACRGAMSALARSLPWFHRGERLLLAEIVHAPFGARSRFPQPLRAACNGVALRNTLLMRAEWAAAAEYHRRSWSRHDSVRAATRVSTRFSPCSTDPAEMPAARSGFRHATTRKGK